MALHTVPQSAGFDLSVLASQFAAHKAINEVVSSCYQVTTHEVNICHCVRVASATVYST